MERKTLGRGLEDISNIFLSTSDEEQNARPKAGFSSVRLREGTCESCANIVDYPSEEPKCRVLTFEYAKYSVPHLAVITPTYARYCNYFKPVDAGTSNQMAGPGVPETDSSQDDCDVEEDIRVHRKIAYPGTTNKQGSIRRALFEHLENGYEISSIELRRVSEVRESLKKRLTNERVSIFLKDPPSS